MFVAHFGMALAAKRLVPRASLAVLILAAQLADVMWTRIDAWRDAGESRFRQAQKSRRPDPDSETAGLSH